MKSNHRFSLLFVFVLSVIGSSIAPSALAQTQVAIPILSRNLTVGDSGTDVSSLQTFFIADGLLSIAQPTGYFGDLTKNAVIAWQAGMGVPATGYFGPLSRNAISTEEVNATGTTMEADTYDRNLTIGDVGTDVSSLQSFLISNGSLAIAAPTGYFGPLTAAAVARWQFADGIPNTGYFGTMSRAKFVAIASLATSTAAATSVASTTLSPAPMIESPISYASGEGGGGGGGGGGSVSAPPATVTPSSTTSKSASTSTSTKAADPPPASTTPATPSSSASASNDNFGLSVGDSMLTMSTTTLNAQLSAMAALGIGWIRFDVQWPDIQPNNNIDYYWTNMNRLVKAAHAHGLNILGILDFTPKWAASSTCVSGNSHCAPANPEAFAAYAHVVVQHYAPLGISAWEIWNEPNLASFWGPKTNCAAYTTLLKDTYPSIKSADPNATVITGGLSPAATDGTNMSPTDFLSCIYKNGGKGYFDAVGDHPYTYPLTPTDDGPGAWDQMFETRPSLRSIMTANGDGNKKIWMTEFGAPTDGPDAEWYVSQASQTVMMTDAFRAYESYSWAGPFFWYTYDDSGSSTSTNENFFGLISEDGVAKPAEAAFKNLIKADL